MRPTKHLILALAVLVFAASGARVAHADTAEPLIVVNHYACRSTFWGPLFALYADGTIIVQKDWNPQTAANLAYVTFRVRDSASLSKALFPYSTRALKPLYTLSSATDQKETSIWIRGNVTRIYGEWEMPQRWASLPAEAREHEYIMQQSLPIGLRRLLSQIETLSRTADAKPWSPPSMDVNFIGYDYAPGPTTPWPDKWRIAEFPERPEKRFFTRSVRFPGSGLDSLREFLDALPDRGAIGIDGLKVAVSAVFIRLPSDQIWSRDIRIATAAYDRRQTPSLYSKGMTPKRWKEMHRLLGRN
jgi:hypothetical protein